MGIMLPSVPFKEETDLQWKAKYDMSSQKNMNVMFCIMSPGHTEKNLMKETLSKWLKKKSRRSTKKELFEFISNFQIILSL